LVRPGRARLELGSWLLARRVRTHELWAPDDAGMLVIMLVHNALTDHVTHRLIRAVDLDRWARRPQAAWSDAVDVIGRAGLRGAAWATLEWTRTALATPIPPEVSRALAPSRARQRYLRAWLARDPARLYRRHPLLVRAAFSLSLHDAPKDVARALASLACAARESEHECAGINRVLRGG